MQFDQKTIVTLLIGIVIGGVGIGLIDANRPKPLFSSASEGSNPFSPCETLYTNYHQYNYYYRIGTQGYNWDTMVQLGNNFDNCIQTVRDALNAN